MTHDKLHRHRATTSATDPGLETRGSDATHLEVEPLGIARSHRVDRGDRHQLPTPRRVREHPPIFPPRLGALILEVWAEDDELHEVGLRPGDLVEQHARSDCIYRPTAWRTRWEWVGGFLRWAGAYCGRCGEDAVRR